MVQLSRPGWRAAAITTSLLVSLVSAPAAPAAAHQDLRKPSSRVVATGLNNPRHVRWSNGALYIAEAGVGGSSRACVPSAEGGDACYGASGSITRLKQHRQSRVATGLPSVAEKGGANALGPADLLVHGRRYTVAIGLGADPKLRPTTPRNARKLATVSTGRFGHRGLSVVADIGRYEAKKNPDGGKRDTNPVALLRRRGKTYVVDAGGNSLLTLRRHGRVKAKAVFPDKQVLAPDSLGLPPGTKIPMQAVPTAAAKGPDGAIYVSQLTGFPFPVGGASIWRIARGHAPTKYATGLTNVTDLAFGGDGSLYVVQIADQGLLDQHATGSVQRIPAGGGARHSTVVGHLKAPYGIALHHGSAYVTTCSVCAGDGEVLRVRLHRHS